MEGLPSLEELEREGIDLEGFNLSDLEKFLKPGGFSNFSYFPPAPGPSTNEMAVKLFFYSISMFMGLFGNANIIFVILITKSLRTAFNLYMVNLSVADLMVVVFCMWVHLANDLSPVWPFGETVCRMNTFLQVLSVTASILTLTTLVVDRFMAATFPTTRCVTQSWQKLTLVIIWVISFLISLPWLLYNELIDFDWAGGHERYCQEVFPSARSRRGYMTFFTCAVYIVPVVSMLTMVTATHVRCGDNHVGAVRPSIDVALAMKKRAQQLLTAVLVIFIICWTPQQATLLWDVYRDPDKPKPPNIGAIKYASLYLAYTNSAINPVIYVIFNKCFRHALRQLLKCNFRYAGETSVTPVRSISLTTINST